MLRRPPRSTRTDTLFPYTTLFRSIESLPEIFSSEVGGITLADFLPESDVKMPMFIARDRPVHTAQRRSVAPAFTPSEMVRMSDDIRRRTAEVLDTLPVGERSEEHTSELQSLMRISYAVFCLKKKKNINNHMTVHETKRTI